MYCEFLISFFRSHFLGDRNLVSLTLDNSDVYDTSSNWVIKFEHVHVIVIKEEENYLERKHHDTWEEFNNLIAKMESRGSGVFPHRNKPGSIHISQQSQESDTPITNNVTKPTTLTAPLTPRIDISRASSSSYHEDSSPENVFDQVSESRACAGFDVMFLCVGGWAIFNFQHFHTPIAIKVKSHVNCGPVVKCEIN